MALGIALGVELWEELLFASPCSLHLLQGSCAIFGSMV